MFAKITFNTALEMLTHLSLSRKLFEKNLLLLQKAVLRHPPEKLEVRQFPLTSLRPGGPQSLQVWLPCTAVTQLLRGWLRTQACQSSSPCFVTHIPLSTATSTKSLLLSWPWFLISKAKEGTRWFLKPWHDPEAVLKAEISSSHTAGGTGMNLSPKIPDTLPTKRCPSPSDTTRMESLATDVTAFQHSLQRI